MGAVAAELHSLGHRSNFFYLQHAMGLASSTGLGLAMCLPNQKVVVFDGDGSVLMNLGGLTTLARYRPANLVHVIFDNESLLSVGGFPTATSTGSDLEALARGAGIARAAVRGLELHIDGKGLASMPLANTIHARRNIGKRRAARNVEAHGAVFELDPHPIAMKDGWLLG